MTDCAHAATGGTYRVSPNVAGTGDGTWCRRSWVPSRSSTISSGSVSRAHSPVVFFESQRRLHVRSWRLGPVLLPICIAW